MDAICFTIPRKAPGKSARARTFYNPKTKGMSSVTPEKTVLYENLIATCYMDKAGNDRFSDDSYLLVRIQAFYEPPKSVSKKKRSEMLGGKILPAKKPDIDNVVKAVLDALNGISFYRDDAQVIELHVRKSYSEKPRVEVCIGKI